MAATERIPVLVTPIEKKQVVAKKKAGLKTSEFMRLAAASFRPNVRSAKLTMNHVVTSALLRQTRVGR